VARQRQALARRECLQLRSSHSVSRHRALFRREVEAAAAREGRAMAQQRAAAAATAAAERRRSRSTSRRGRRRASRGGGSAGGADSDASTYCSSEGSESEEGEAGSSVGGSRRHTARARAAAALRLPRPSPFFGPRAVDHVATHMDADVCVTSSLARVGHSFHTVVASAVRAPTVVVRQCRRSRGRGGSVSSSGTGVGGGGCGGSVMTDARSHASATSAALAEARRREGALAAQRRAAARERGRAAGCALRQEREGTHALETLARLDAAAAAAAFAAGSRASSASGPASERGGPIGAAAGASSAAPRCLASSIPIVRPAFMAGRGGGEVEGAAPWPPQPSSRRRDGLGGDRMDLRSDDVAAYGYAAPPAGGGAMGWGQQSESNARASAAAARSGAALSVPAGTRIGGAGVTRPLLLSLGSGHRAPAAWGSPLPAGEIGGETREEKEEAEDDGAAGWGYGRRGHGATARGGTGRGAASVDLSGVSVPSGTCPPPPRLRSGLRPTSTAGTRRPAERASMQRRPASETELEAAFEHMLLTGT
jgi:hypothetical protein